LQLEQNKDNARYLSELNTARHLSGLCLTVNAHTYLSLNQWLGTFVENAGAQNATLAASVQQLCATLGVSASSDGHNALPGQTSTGRIVPPGRENTVAALHDAVNGLVASVDEERKARASSLLSELLMVFANLG
jgi:hypothetical protein